MRAISPNTVIFSDIGPHIRWVGNEKGIAGETNWNLLDTAGFTPGAGGPPTDTLNKGNINGKNWIPAECDVSIRPGWFFHENENEKVKTPEQLFELYLKSVGRGANFLLNVPPDRRGLIHANDSSSLIRFKMILEMNFRKNLVKNAKAESIYGPAIFDKQFFADGDNTTFENPVDYINSLYSITFKKSQEINCIVLQEAIQNGQQIKSFEINIVKRDTTLKTISGTTVGRKRILTFPRLEASGILIKITDARDTPQLSEVGVYLINEKLVERILD